MLARSNGPRILESHCIRDILKLINHDTCLLLDIDNTIMEPLYGLGSDQWFTALIQHACQQILNQAEAIAMVVSIYQAVTHHLRTKVIEPEIIHMIKALQDMGIPVLALTARGGELVDTTFRQLGEIGINLTRNRDPHEHRINLQKVQTSKPVYHRGIIFCDGADKGTCLKDFLAKCENHPKHVVMVDDKEKHLQHVAEAATSLNIRFDGMRYGLLDEKVKQLNMQEASHQLAKIKDKLPASVQQYIDQLQIVSQDHSMQESNYTDFFVTDPFKQHVAPIRLHTNRPIVKSTSATSFFSAKQVGNVALEEKPRDVVSRHELPKLG